VNLLSENKRFLDFLGVSKFHDAGYFGERGLTATGETWDLKDYDDEFIIKPYDLSENGKHAIETAKTFRQIAPQCKLVQLPYIDLIGKCIPVIKDMGISVMFTSWSGKYNNANWDKALDDINIFYCMSSGNDNETEYNHYLENKNIYGVGAYYLKYPSNEAIMAKYSSATEYVDFSAPTLINVPIGNDCYPFSGTSCSCPVLAGMCALVNDFFIDKTGKPLSRKMMYQFLKDYSVDIYTEGKDTKSGWGAVRLPDPKDIDIKKYAEVMTVEYKDKSDISSWALSAVENCYNSGIMAGDANGNFNPQKPITREEIAIIADRIIKIIKR